MAANAAATQLESRGQANFHGPNQAAATAPSGRVSSRKSMSAPSASWRCAGVRPGTEPAASQRCTALCGGPARDGSASPVGDAVRAADTEPSADAEPLWDTEPPRDAESSRDDGLGGNTLIPSGAERWAVIPPSSSRGGGAAQAVTEVTHSTAAAPVTVPASHVHRCV